MKNEGDWLFRVNGKTYDEWLASRRATDPESLEAATTVMTTANGTPTSGRSATPDKSNTAPVAEAARRWESAADRPRIVCWRQPPTHAQEVHARETGEVVFVPSCGPAWQGRRGRQPSPVRTRKEDR